MRNRLVAVLLFTSAATLLAEDLAGTLDSAPYRIKVPPNWNGTLLVYLMGVKSPANNPAVAPVTPPALQGEPALEETLLSRGYALAGTLVAERDIQVKEEAQDALTLTAYFRGRVGDPQRVIVWGTSLGGIVALRLIEEFPRSYDAAIAMCPPAGGVAKSFDQRLDFLLSYEAAFGWPEEWGTLEDLRTGLDFVRDVQPKVQWPRPDGSNRGLWEFVRLVNGVASDAFWLPDPMWGSVGYASTMWMATQLRESMEAGAGGPFVQNAGRRYTLTSDEKTYLATLGVNAEALLAKMNSRSNIVPSLEARKYIERFGEVRGRLSKPVLTMHNTVDPNADVRHESAYLALVSQSGCSGYLDQAFVDSVGHCAFTSGQILVALGAMERWLDSGVKPDASAFPSSGGFNSRFVPADYPF